jgi:hypothetical protein
MKLFSLIFVMFHPVWLKRWKRHFVLIFQFFNLEPRPPGQMAGTAAMATTLITNCEITAVRTSVAEFPFECGLLNLT